MNRAFIVVGLGFGDEGKGTTVDALVREFKADIVVRYNGGAQAAHAVHTDLGMVHSFRQFGAGSFVPNVKTLLSDHMFVNPLSMLLEADNLPLAVFHRTFVDERAVITTPFHRALNRLKELHRGSGAHGSVGFGVGETKADLLARGDNVVRIGDLRDFNRFKEKLFLTRAVMWEQVQPYIQEKLSDAQLVEIDTFNDDYSRMLDGYARWAKLVKILTPEQVRTLLHESGTAVFEGAQGVLLDETYGFPPNNTWTKTTTENAHLMLLEFDLGIVGEDVGVLRTFATRHGPGPFPTYREGFNLLVEKGENNEWNPWQKDFRYGYLDLPLLKYALRVNHGVDWLAVTHIDKLALLPSWHICDAYYRKLPETVPTEKTTALLANMTWNGRNVKTKKIIDLISSELSTPVLMESHGPAFKHKKFLCGFTS